MIEDITFLHTLLTREGYNKYSKYVAGLTLEDETKLILDTIASYFEEYKDAQEISHSELCLHFALNYPAYKDKELIETMLTMLEHFNVKEELVDRHISKMIERHYAAKVIDGLTNVLDGKETGKLLDTHEHLESFEKAMSGIEKGDNEFVDACLNDLLEKEVKGDGLKWRLDCLNKDIGDLRGGSLGHIFARVDTGKTTFLVSEATHFAEQLEGDEVILWFNNEEKGSKVQLRIFSGMLGLSKDELVTHAEKVELKFKEVGGDRIKLYDSALIDIQDIEKMLKKHNVRLVVIDQGDKIKFRGDGKYAEHERLKALYGKFRELAKQYDCDIITAGQADMQAHGRKWLELTNMDNSKTGKPGELDYAIGIGKIFGGVENVRFVNVCKNKMKDGAHGKHEVLMTPAIARYTD